MPSIPVIVSMLAAAITSFSRVFEQTRPAWGRLPAWVQSLAPTILAACGFIVAGLAHVTTATDLTVVIVGGLMVLLPGLPSNRSAAPLKAGKPVTGTPSAGDLAVAASIKTGSDDEKLPPPPKPPSGLAVASLFVLCASMTGCGLFAAAAPYLAEAAVLISDAVNAVDAAQALLPSLHLTEAEQAQAEKIIAKARLALAAAAKADDGATDLTAEQLDASLADFRAAWADLQGTLSAKRIGAAEGALALPVPLAVRRVKK